MPRYVYEVISESGEAGQRFEVHQKMSDPPLTEHPETGEPVRRVITAPNIAGRLSPMRPEKALADDSKLARMGFTKYVKGDRGYEKAAGSGPDLPKGKR